MFLVALYTDQHVSIVVTIFRYNSAQKLSTFVLLCCISTVSEDGLLFSFKVVFFGFASRRENLLVLSQLLEAKHALWVIASVV